MQEFYQRSKMWDCRQGWQGSLGDKGIHQREIQGERTLVSQLAASNKCRSGFGRQITVEPDTFFTPCTRHRGAQRRPNKRALLAKLPATK